MGHWTTDTRLRVFARSSSWIEGDAIRQLEKLTELDGFVAAAGMPDLHPGPRGPVGCALLTEGVVHPAIVGTDIGCGMTAWLAKGARLPRLDRVARRLEAAGQEAAARSPGEAGSIGGGNHFVELQRITAAAPEAGVADGDLVVLVHSGSRAMGAEVARRHGSEALPLADRGEAYLRDHDAAVAFARLNRAALAAMAADALGLAAEPWLDVPHNLAEAADGRVLHRKGAAPADRGLVPVPGSRGTATHYVLPAAGIDGSLRSVCHGAGRKRRRAEGRPARAGAEPSILLCQDTRLAREEAPDMYKDIRAVVGDLEAFGLARSVASAEPLITLKGGEARHGRD